MPEHGTFTASHEYGFSEDEEAAVTEREFGLGDFPLLDSATGQNHMLTIPLPPEADPRSWVEIQPVRSLIPPPPTAC